MGDVRAFNLSVVGILFLFSASFSRGDEQSPPNGAPLKRYTIRENDTLWDLAGKFYGKPWIWPEFLRFNLIENPDLIYPGDELWIPNLETLEGLKGKNMEEIKKVREEVLASATPEVLEPVAPESIRPTPLPSAFPALAAPSPAPTPTLKVTGSKSINLAYSEARGERGAGFTNTGYDRHEALRLALEGQLYDAVKIKGNFAQSDLAQEDTFDLTLSYRSWELFFGDFAVGFSGGRWLSSGLSATGVRLKGTPGSWRIETLLAAPRGRTLYEKFYGNNTQGPYPLSGAPLVAGTEQVWLNKTPLTRGVDYEVDPVLGRLEFLKVIPEPVDLIEVRAESRAAVFETQVAGYRLERALVRKKEKDRWTLSQGLLRQRERPDAQVTSQTGRAATDTMIAELASKIDLGPSLIASFEGAWSFVDSFDEAHMGDVKGAAAGARVESFQGPFHVQGDFSRTQRGFRTIGDPLRENDFREWNVSADIKEGEAFFARASRGFQRTNATAQNDETVLDHAEARFAPKGAPSVDYTYYRNFQRTQGSPSFFQELKRHDAGLGFTPFRVFEVKFSGEGEEKEGSALEQIHSGAGRMEIALTGDSSILFSAMGEWKWNRFGEASSNTVSSSTGSSGTRPSQTYALTLEGRPFSLLTLSTQGTYTSDPPGPARGRGATSFRGDFFSWFTADGAYSLEFEQHRTEGVEAPQRVHTGSGSARFLPAAWLKLEARPSFRLEVLSPGGQKISENIHQGYQGEFQSSFMNAGVLYSRDRFATWGSDAMDFPLSFEQETENRVVNGTKTFPGGVVAEAAYQRTLQNQISPLSPASSERRTWNRKIREALSAPLGGFGSIRLEHTFAMLEQTAPGGGIAENPLFPYGPDTFNTAFPTVDVNVFTRAHTFSGRLTENVTPSFSLYQEGGYTRTRDELRRGLTRTISPAAGFQWSPGGFLSWSGSYRFNFSSGQVETRSHQAQTTLSAAFREGAGLSVNWNFTRADRPFLQSQQGTVSYTMNF